MCAILATFTGQIESYLLALLACFTCADMIDTRGVPPYSHTEPQGCKHEFLATGEKQLFSKPTGLWIYMHQHMHKPQ